MNNLPNFPQAPQNIRSKTTGKLELRKLWHIPEARYIWALYIEYEQETCAMNGEGKHAVPDWTKIVKKETGWQNPQGYVGDEEWGKKTAEHFKIDFPEEEYQGE